MRPEGPTAAFEEGWRAAQKTLSTGPDLATFPPGVELIDDKLHHVVLRKTIDVELLQQESEISRREQGYRIAELGRGKS